jgi:hypothetical protein
VRPPAPARTRRRLPLGLIALALLAFGQVACGGRAIAIPFADHHGRITELTAEPRSGEAHRIARREGVGPAQLAPAVGVSSSALYRLSEPLTLGPGDGLFVEVSGRTGQLLVEISTENQTPRWFEPIAVAGAASVRHQILLPVGTSISALRISTPASDGRAELLGAGAEPVGRRLSFSRDLAVTSNNLPLQGRHLLDGASGTLQRLHVGVASDLLTELGERWLLALSLIAIPPAASGDAVGSPDPGMVTIALSAGARRRSFLVRTAGSRQFVQVHAGTVGFMPDEVVVEATATVGIRSLVFEPLPAPASPHQLRAIPADPATILGLTPDAWRGADFELYAWNAATEDAPILIFDTANYRVQAALFRRLAFFAEKRVSRGQVWTDVQLANRRGWNAHDYAAGDLAEFFSAAARESIALTDEELTLRALLEGHGIIAPGGGAWRVGAGAVLSISRESGAWLRRLLLNHELLHGLYFTNPAFAAEVTSTWSEQAADVQSFWRLLFGFIGYDVQHSPLVTNEFQAYLLQQARADMVGFVDLWLGRLGRAYPDRTALLERVKSEPGAFLKAYDAVHLALRTTTGQNSNELAAMRFE